ncbi:glucose-6-phosphate dehydrogenase assembly protein OpcA [Zhihengliuella flava]|uniref:Glucose-6-phosphate dehydrogenase assembly protein OpcA n=1 Tax=Zhihengliuella flava TaxID=1285193 RepID=A0A931GEF9_9MICC|nr:glucose-6-phosphate dehydrogenase assembly protein OpcA [Zhihengliuella flava]MBG6083477.1 glucose-6-phosphate dehydrogenase assembly protein OpcA [Zhihengliuella flava]
MIVDLEKTTTSKVAKQLQKLREAGGVVALSRVLTLVVLTTEGFEEPAIEAANLASREHPCRIIVVVEGTADRDTRLDAQIRVGGDAGASEVIVLRGQGELAATNQALVSGLLLPDAPIVAWWPHGVPEQASETPIGRIAHRRITDSQVEAAPRAALWRISDHYVAGDTDLAWTRITLWRAQLASVLDQIDPASISSVTVKGAGDSSSTDLLAAWLTLTLDVPVTIASTTPGTGVRSVRLSRADGDVVLTRPHGHVAELYQQDQPVQRISMPRRPLSDCLAEELRRLDPDEVFGEVVTEGLRKTNLRSVVASER